MNFYSVVKRFEDVLFGLGYYHDWDNGGNLNFYMGGIKCFHIDYKNNKLCYKNRIDDEFFVEYNYAFYTTEENIKNFIEMIRQKAANFIKFIKKEQVINTRLEELEKDFV